MTPPETGNPVSGRAGGYSRLCATNTPRDDPNYCAAIRITSHAMSGPARATPLRRVRRRSPRARGRVARRRARARPRSRRSECRRGPSAGRGSDSSATLVPSAAAVAACPARSTRARRRVRAGFDVMSDPRLDLAEDDEPGVGRYEVELARGRAEVAGEHLVARPVRCAPARRSPRTPSRRRCGSCRGDPGRSGTVGVVVTTVGRGCRSTIAQPRNDAPAPDTKSADSAPSRERS